MKNMNFEEIPMLKIAVSMVMGILAGQSAMVGTSWLLAVLVALLAVALLSWRHPQWQSVSISLCFVALGWLLMQRQKESLHVAWPEGEVCYEAVVISEPVEKPKTVAVDILLPENGRRLKAYLYKDQRSLGLQIGDGLHIQSRIEPNSDWHRGTFDYRRYLEIHGFTGRTYVASWKWQKAMVSLDGLSRLERTRLFFLQLRHRLLVRFSTVEAEGDALAVVAAMVLGDKSALTQDLKDVYAVSGASHVLALSGLHLGIIYTLLTLLLGGRKLFTIHCSLFTILGIWAYVFLVGIPVSVVRSALMLSLYALLSVGGRDRMSLSALAFAAVVMILFNPLSLFDVGFQLSFVALLSIVLWVPLLMGLFPADYLLSHRAVRWLWSMFAVSLAAQIGVAPLVAYYFGYFSPWFLLTNFIAVPAATLILWLAPVVLLFPVLLPMLLTVVAGLNAFLTLVTRLPGANISHLQPSGLQVAMVYVIVIAIYLLVTRLQCLHYHH